MKVVLPDGSLATFGGRTLKNVAGYDVGKLFIGSLGSIGVIAEATVRLLPMPACEELLLVTVPGLEQGRRLVARILGSPLLPSSLEFMSPACVGLLSLDRAVSPHGDTYVMLIALEGHAAAVERQERDISAFCAELSAGAGGVESRRASEVGLSPDDAWEVFAGLRARALDATSTVGLRCTVPLAHVWDLAAAVEEHSRANDITASYTMDCGTGYLEAYAAGSPAGLRAFARAVRADAEKREGAATVLGGWPVLGTDFDAWGTPRTDFKLIKAVKQKFDPQGIMNPGRFVGGL